MNISHVRRLKHVHWTSRGRLRTSHRRLVRPNTSNGRLDLTSTRRPKWTSKSVSHRTTRGRPMDVNLDVLRTSVGRLFARWEAKRRSSSQAYLSHDHWSCQCTFTLGSVVDPSQVLSELVYLGRLYMMLSISPQ